MINQSVLPSYASPSHRVLRWNDGPAEGIYLDFDNQIVGFRGSPAVHLEYRVVQVLEYLYVHGSTSAAVLQLDAELNSVQLPKMISKFKRACLDAVGNELDEESANRLFDSLLHKGKINGHIAYTLCTDMAVLSSDESVFAAFTEEPGSSEEAAASATAVSSFDKKNDLRFIGSTLKANGIPLTVLCFALLCFHLYADIRQLTVSAAFSVILDLPDRSFIIFSILFALSPVLLGLLIDVPLALIGYYMRTGKRPALREIPAIATYGDPERYIPGAGRFHMSKVFVAHLAFCNLFSALSMSYLLLFVRSLPGFAGFLSGRTTHYFVHFIAIICMVLSVFVNIQDLRPPYPKNAEIGTRNPDNYLLSRFGAFANMLFLAFALFFVCVMALGILWGLPGLFRSPMKLPAPFLLMLAAVYLFTWFAMVSPFAKMVDSRGSGNYTTMPPIIAGVSSAYVLLAFRFSLNSLIALLLSAAALALWLYRMILYKKHPEYRGLPFAVQVPVAVFLAAVLPLFQLLL